MKLSYGCGSDGKSTLIIKSSLNADYVWQLIRQVELRTSYPVALNWLIQVSDAFEA